MKQDKYGAQVLLAWEKHLTHHGQMFGVFDEAASVAIVTPKLWLLKVDTVANGAPAGGVALAVTIAGTNGYKVELYEAPTSSADGTGLAVVPLNRVDQERLTGFTAFKDPTVSVDGTQVGVARGAGGGPVSPGGGSVHMLKPGTNYEIKVTVTVDASVVTMSAFAYPGQT